jgi:hypothetical protein
LNDNSVTANLTSELASGTTKFQKLDSKTPIFKSSTREDVETWLYKVETALEVACIPETHWLAAISNYVEGTAFEMVRSASTEKRTWADFKDKLVKTFRPTYKDFNLRSELLKLKDTGNFDEYLYKFRAITNKVSQKVVSEQDKFTCFVQGLKLNTRKELFIKEVKDLEDAILLASKIENIDLSTSRENNVSAVNVVQTRKNFDREKNIKNKKYIEESDEEEQEGEENSAREEEEEDVEEEENDRRHRNSSNRKNLNNIQCWYCKSYGHYKVNCKRREKDL